jgi:2-phosphosulfolactate phosphatase
MLNISVRALPSEAMPAKLSDRAIAVIDVLRATTVMATALNNGARNIFTTPDVDAARRLKARLETESLLCGERYGRRIDGFDLGNSPYEFDKRTVENKTLIMCTTNGTKAVEVARGASLLIALSFVNLSAAAKVLLDKGLPVELLCSGTNGRFSLDDALCAGMTIAWLAKQTRVQTDDLGQLLHAFALQEGQIGQKLANCSHRLFLESSGFANDITYCFDLDRFQTVPVFTSEGCFVPFNP